MKDNNYQPSWQPVNSGIQSRLYGYAIQTSVYGKPIPIVFGTNRIAATPVWANNWDAKPVGSKLKGGGGKGGAGQQYDYFTSIILALCQGPIQGVSQIWIDQIRFVVNKYEESYTVPLHGGTFTPTFANAFLTDLGVYAVEAFSVNVNDYGSPGIVNLSGDQNIAYSSIAGGSINGVPVINGGARYAAAPTVTLQSVDGNGSGATAQCVMGPDPANQVAYLNNDPVPALVVQAIIVTNAGSGYTAPPRVNFQAVAGDQFGAGATAIASLGPPAAMGAGQYYYNASDNTYTFSTANAGTVIQIAYGWIQGSPLNGGPAASANFAVITGDLGQPPWIEIISSNPNQAIGYSEVAYAAAERFELGSTGVAPNMTWEVLGFAIWGGSIVDAPVLMPRPALAKVNLSGGAVASLSLQYTPTYFASAPTVQIVGDGINARVTANINADGQIISFNVAAGGSGYTHATAFIGPQLETAAGGIIHALLTDPLYGAGMAAYEIGDTTDVGTYCIANGLFISPILESQRPAADWIKEYLEVANAEGFWSEGVLKFRTYGDVSAVGNGMVFNPDTQPIYDLDVDDFHDQEPLIVERPTVKDAFNRKTVEWSNRNNSYAYETVYEDDLYHIALYGLRPDQPMSLHGITSQAVAAFVASVKVQRSVYIRNKFKFKLGPQYMRLEPMDLVTVTDPFLGLITHPVRILSIEETEDHAFEIEAEDFPWGTNTPTKYPKQVTSTFGPGFFAAPGDVFPPIFWEPTAQQAQSQDYLLWIALCGGTNWGGCDVWASDNGESYVKIGRQNGPATMGVLTSPLADGANPDDVNTLSVNLIESFGDLASYTQTQEDALVSLCLVDQELLSYRSAELFAASSFNLTHLRRGAYGTPIQTHATNANFVFFNNALFVWHYTADKVGKTIYFKFTSFNKANQREQDLSEVPVYTYRIRNPRSPYPWNPNSEEPFEFPNDPLSNLDSFAIQQIDQDTGEIFYAITGEGTINHFTAKTVPPAIAFDSLVTNVGLIPSGVRVVVGVTAIGTDGYQSDLSQIVEYDVPLGSDTNMLRFTIKFANDSDIGLVYVAVGDDSRGLLVQSSVPAGSTMFIVPTVSPGGSGCPDPRFDHYLVRAKWECHAGIWGGTLTSLGPYTLQFDGCNWDINQMVGRVVTLLGKGDFSRIPLINARIVSNTGDTLTVDKDFSAPIGNAPPPVQAGDVFVIRAIATSCTPTKVTDTAWINGGGGQPGTGLADNEDQGHVLWVIDGKGAGQIVPIASNDATSLNLSSPLTELLDETSIYVVVELNWSTLLISNTMDIAIHSTLQLLAPMTANPTDTYVVQVLTVDATDDESDEIFSPIREVYFFGGVKTEISAAPFTVTQEGYAMLTVNDLSLETETGIGTIREFNFFAPQVDETDFLIGNGSIDATSDPVTFSPQIVDSFSRFGSTFEVGDYIIWITPGSYEIDLITALDGIQMTLQRTPAGGGATDAFFGSLKSAHTLGHFMKIIPRLLPQAIRQDTFGTEAPVTDSGFPKKWEWAIANKMIAGVVSQAVGDRGLGAPHSVNLEQGSDTTPAPGLRMMNGAAYKAMQITGQGGGAFVAAALSGGGLGTLTLVTGGVYAVTPIAVVRGDGTGATVTVSFSGNTVTSVAVGVAGSGYTHAFIEFLPQLSVCQTLPKRFQVDAWESIRTVTATLAVAATGAGFIAYVVYLSPDQGSAYVLEKLTISQGNVISWPPLDPPEDRQMPYHQDWVAPSVAGAALPDFPPNIFPKIISPFDANGHLKLPSGQSSFNLDPTSFAQLSNGGWIDVIIAQVGSTIAGCELSVNLQT